MSAGDNPNPYESPKSLFCDQSETGFQSSKWLRICANGILLVGWLQIFIGVVGSIVLPIVYLSGFFSRFGGLPGWAIALEFVCVPVFFVRTIYMINRAKHLRAGTNYKAARTAAILAALGIFFPFSPYEVPFGIGALVILLRKDFRPAQAEPH